MIDSAAHEVGAVLTEAQREQAMARYEVLRPHLENRIALAEAARQAGVALRTAQRWLASYRERGLVGLARRARSDRGRRAVSDQQVTLIEGLALRRPALSAASIHRQVAEIAVEHDWVSGDPCRAGRNNHCPQGTDRRAQRPPPPTTPRPTRTQQGCRPAFGRPPPRLLPPADRYRVMGLPVGSAAGDAARALFDHGRGSNAFTAWMHRESAG